MITRGRPWFGSITFRIWLPFAMAIASVLGVMGVVYPARQAELFRDSAALRLSDLARATALGVEFALEADDLGLLARTMASIRSSQDFAFVALIQVGEAGEEQVLASNPSDMDPASILDASDGSMYVVSDAIVSSTDFDGVVRVGALGADVDAEVAQLRRVAFRLVFFLLFVSLTLSAWVARAVSRPIVALTSAAERLADGDYDVPIAVPNDRSEIGDLSRSLAGLQGALTDARQRMARYVDGVVEAKEAAEAAARAKTFFVANVSHELRTPINAVLGLAHLCLRGDLSERQRDYLTKIDVASRNLASLVDDVLDFSKLESGAVQLEQEPFCVSELVSQVETVVKSGLDKPALRVEFTVDRELPETLMGDALRLQQILVNLAGNAVKFTDRGLVRVHLQEESRSGSSVRVQMSVVDTGIGMDPATVRSLFRPFKQADPSTTRKFGGTGLGLVITKRLVEAMEGTLTVTSELASGSTFVANVVLQVADGAAVRVSNSAGQRHSDGWVPKLSGLRVLVAEDNPFNRLVARELIESTGAHVTVAEDGISAVEAVLHGDAIDIVLMDVQMPRLDGHGAARQIRDHAAEAPVMIAMTANVTAADRRLARESGMHDFLAKPVDPAALFETLSRWSESHGSSRATSSTDAGPPGQSDPVVDPIAGGQEDQPLFDPAALDRLAGGDPDRVVRFRSSVMDSARETAQALARGRTIRDRGEIGRIAHRFKAVAGTVGAMLLSQECEELEVMCSDDSDVSWGVIDARCQDLIDQVELLAHQLGGEPAGRAASLPRPTHG